MTPEPVRLIVVKAAAFAGVFSALIRFVQAVHVAQRWLTCRRLNPHWNAVHVALEYRGAVVEALPDGVVQHPLAAMIARYRGNAGIQIWAVPCLDRLRAINAYHIMETRYVGYEYDWIGAAKAGIDLLEYLPVIGRLFKDRTIPSHGWCSEIIAKAFGDGMPGDCTPMDECSKRRWPWSRAERLL